MAGNVPAISRNSFDFDKSYGAVYLQEGVPIMDSDWNESVDNIWVRGLQLPNKALFGNVRLAHYAPDGTASADSGFKIMAGGGDNNFTLSDGYACCHGVFVASTDSSPPTSVTYDDQIISAGAVTGVGSGQLTDTGKNWDSGHQLVGCIVRMTSGTEDTHEFVVQSVDSATVLTLTGGTGSISPADTYEIAPPALTTPSGSDRTDLAYLQVFFEDIASEEDPNSADPATSIVHPDTGLEAVHKTRIRSVVRVLEGSVTLPTTAATITDGYGVRYMTLGTISRTDGVAAITVLTPETNFRANLENLSSISVLHDPTTIAGLGYSLTAGADTIGEVLDEALTLLASQTSDSGADLIGVPALSSTPSSVAAGSLESALLQLLGDVNGRIMAQHPTASVTAPILLWRSGDVSDDASVTKDTLSIYLLPANVLTTSATVRVAYCTGFYLDGSLAYIAPSGTAPTVATMTILGDEIQFLSKHPLTATWAWASAGSWVSGMAYAPEGPSSSGLLSVLDPTYFGGAVGLGDDSYIQPTATAGLRPLIKTFVGVTPSGGMYTDGTEIWLTSNVVWNSGAGTWSAANTLYDCHAVLFGSIFGSLISYHMAKGTTEHTTSWTRYDWGTTQILGTAADDEMGPSSGYTYSGFLSSGNLYERVHFSAETYVSATINESAGTLGLTASCNLRARRTSYAAGVYHLTFTPSALLPPLYTSANTTASVTAIDGWGCKIDMVGLAVGASYPDGASYGGYGYVDVWE